MSALDETETGAGEKLTSSEAVEVNPPEPVAMSALGAAGAATGLGAGFTAGLGVGFRKATGMPFFIGDSKLTTFTGAGLGFGAGFETGAFVAGTLAAGALAAGALAAGVTVRLVVTDFAQTVTEVDPVFDE